MSLPARIVDLAEALRAEGLAIGTSELLDAFAALRTANLALVAGTPADRWERLGIHEERGPTSFRVLTQTMAGHDRAHLRQLEQTIAAVRPARG